MIRITHVTDKHRNVIFKQMPLAHQWCTGNGIEFGAAAHNPFGLEGSINVAPEDGFDLYKQAQVDLCGAFAEVDLWASAVDVPLKASSQDYIISSHVIEHIPNLFKVLDEAERLLKKGGIFFAIVPERNALPSDRGRPLTELQEFIDDYENQVTPDTKGYEPRGGHCYVFSLESLIEAINHHKPHWELVASEAKDSKVGNGHTVVYRTTKKPKR